MSGFDFGAPAPAPAPAFGERVGEGDLGGFGLFGNPAAAAVAPSPFASQAPAPSLFGGASRLAASGFATGNGGSSFRAPAPSTGSLFGNTAPAAASRAGRGGSLFGSRGQTNPLTTWYPKTLDMYQGMEMVVETAESSDVSFEFMFYEGKDGYSSSNDAEGNLLYAHKGILACRAPTIYDLVKDAQPDEIITITNVSRHVFKSLLVHIYSGCIPSEIATDEAFAKDLLLASDFYGCIYLKLYVESIITNKVLDTGNAADWIVVADTYKCPLMKEACMALISNYPDEVVASGGWLKVEESPTLGFDLFRFTALMKSKDTQAESGLFPMPKSKEMILKKTETWSVSTLRQCLQSEHLDLDGTKEMLARRLAEHYFQKTRAGAATAQASLPNGEEGGAEDEEN